MLFCYTQILVLTQLSPHQLHLVTDGNQCRDPLPNIRPSSENCQIEGEKIIQATGVENPQNQLMSSPSLK